MTPRHELKFAVPATEALVLSRRLGALLHRDPHAGADGRYTVRSLYFDTPADGALRAGHEGYSRRAKWRLRTYTDGASDAPRTFVLEKKMKRAGLGTKAKAALTPEQAYVLAAPGPTDASLMAALSPPDSPLDPVLAEFCALTAAEPLVARTVVVYEREAYLHRAGNVRITLDTDVRAHPHPDALFDPARLLVPVAPGEAVVEVKYDAFLPTWVADAVRPGTARTAWSKYALARRLE